MWFLETIALLVDCNLWLSAHGEDMAVHIRDLLSATDRWQVTAIPVSSGWPTVVLGVNAAIKSKSNFRTGGRERWSQYAAFEDQLRLTFRKHRPSDWQVPAVKTPPPVKDRPRVVAAIWAETLLDSGNLSKSVLDAGERVLYVSDAEVAGDSHLVTRSRDGRRFVVGFSQLPPGSGVQMCSSALAELTGIVGRGWPET